MVIMNHVSRHKTIAQGFTVVELMLAITISGLLLAALYSFYLMQKKTGEIQQDVAAVQQDLRGLMQMMAQDIHMAGYAPVDGGEFGFQNDVTFYGNGSGSDSGIETNAKSIAFTSDMNDLSFTGDAGDKSNGVVDHVNGQNQQEQFAYRWLESSVSGVCANRGCIQRYLPNTASRWQNVAYDIDGLEFLYTLRDGTVTLSPAATNNLNNIVSVTVSILAKGHSLEQGFSNSETYRPASCFQSALTLDPASCATAFNNGRPYNDNLRRQMLTFTASCRNRK